VAVAVHLADGVELLLQGFAVGHEADDGQDEGGVVLVGRGASDLEDFGVVAAVDAVARGQARVASYDGELVAGDSESRAAVVGVSGRLTG
jgi:hypothetical protein